MNMIKNKKASSIAIFILFFSVLVLIAASLFHFHTTNLKVKDTILATNYNDNIKIQQLILDDYLDSIFEESVKDFKPEQGKATFINNFKKEMQVYKIGDSYVVKGLNEVEGQLREDNIKLNSNNLIMKLALNVSIISKITDEDNIYAKYSYKKEFEKVFK